jgi:hypothetical protein
MARKTSSRLELRRQAEAAEAQGGDAAAAEPAVKGKKKEPAVKKKAAPRARRTKTKALVRKRLVWGVFSSSMKEEGRFPYAEREAADAKAVTLAEKHKRTYFVQPIKEIIGERAIELTEEELAEEKEKAKPVRAKKKAKTREEGGDEEESRRDDDFEMPDFGDDDDDD